LSGDGAPFGKLVVSALFSSGTGEGPVIEALQNRFGDIELVSERMPFDHTRYYEAEMGPNLCRRLVSFKDPVPADFLVKAKHRLQEVEDRFRDHGRRRRCNLDPGLLSLQNFVLATHKGYTHRIYLGGGVYAELTLIYQKGGFRPLEWTYPDYASEPMIGLLDAVRDIFLQQRKKSGANRA
jgi:hypothetical protein